MMINARLESIKLTTKMASTTNSDTRYITQLLTFLDIHFNNFFFVLYFDDMKNAQNYSIDNEHTQTLYVYRMNLIAICCVL